MFVHGFNTSTLSNRSHLHQRINEHEESKIHQQCANTFFLRNRKENVSQLLFTNENSLRFKVVTQNRQIMQRIIDVIILIGK